MCPQSGPIGRAASCVLGLLALIASLREFQLARAQQLVAQQGLAGLRAAAALTPGDARIWRDLGGRALRANRLDIAMPALTMAASLNAYDAESLAALGLVAESQGRMRDAEGYLTRAVRVSARYKPRLALASYYFRSGAPDRFWPAAALASHVPAAEPTAIFQMACSLDDPDRVRARLCLDEPAAAMQYLRFLLSRTGTAGLAASALALPPGPIYRDLLVSVCDRLIRGSQTTEAIAVWNHMKGAIALDPARGASLTDGSFEQPGSSGFYWQFTPLSGVEMLPAYGSGLRIELSGKQPQRATLLQQFVPLLPNRRYRLVYAYDTSDLKDPTGLRWALSQLSGKEDAASPPVRANIAGSDSFEFVTSSNTDLLRLSLEYAREPGSMRSEGVLTLRYVKLRLL